MEYSGLLFFNHLMFPEITSGNLVWVSATHFKIAIIAFLAFSGLALYWFRKNLIKKNQYENAEEYAEENEGMKEMLQKCKEQLIDSLHQTNIIYTLGLTGFLDENLSTLKDAIKLKKLLNKKQDKIRNKIFQHATIFEKLSQKGHYYVQLNDYQIRMISSLEHILDPLYEHLNNSHKPFLEAQTDELNNLVNDVSFFISRIIYFIKNDHLNEKETLNLSHIDLNKNIENMGVEQIRRIKSNQVNTRNSILFLNVLSETKNMLNHTSGIFKSYIHLKTDLKIENPNQTETVIQL